MKHASSIGVTLFILVTSPGIADDGIGNVESGQLGPGLTEQGWNLLKKRGTAATTFTLLGEDTIRVEADNSNALIYREVAPANNGHLYLEWEWRVDETTAPTVVTDRRHDDRPLAIYAAFKIEDRYQSLWRRFMNMIAYAAVGLPNSGKILTYVWGGQGEIGDTYPNPYISKVGIVKILRTNASPSGTWFSETVDLLADFEAAFGHPAEALLYIAVSADSEDSEERSVGLVRNLSLARQQAELRLNRPVLVGQ